MGVCCCLQTYNLNVNLEGMGLVLGQSWMVVLINRRILFCPPIIMYCKVCCLNIHSVVNVLVMGLFLGQSLIQWVSCYMQKYLPFLMHYGSAFLLFTRKVHCLQTNFGRSLHIGSLDPT